MLLKILFQENPETRGKKPLVVSVDSLCCHTPKEAKLGSDPVEHSEETAAI